MYKVSQGNIYNTILALSPMIKVWVGGLGEEGTRLELEVAFEKFGPVKNIWQKINIPFVNFY